MLQNIVNTRSFHSNKLCFFSNWIFFLIIFLNCSVHGVDKSHLNNCVTNRNGKFFKLMNSFEFNGSNELSDEWEIMHENTSLSSNGIGAINSNTKNNVLIDKDYLVLFARRENAEKINFTGATITSKTSFSEGRWEIRARLPEGEYLRTAFLTNHSTSTYWFEFGQIDLLVHTQTKELARGIHFANSLESHSYIQKNHISVVNLNEFRIFGMEWSRESLQFFIDDEYSEKILYSDKLHQTWNSSYELRLQLGVGGIPIVLPNETKLLTDLEWNCPAIIIDYIRTYEPFENIENVTCSRNQIEKDRKEIDEQKAVQDICKRYELTSKKRIITLESVVVLCLICSMLAIVYFLFQVRSIKKALPTREEKESQSNMWITSLNKINDEYIEEGYDEIRNEEADNQNEYDRNIYEPSYLEIINLPKTTEENVQNS